MIKKYLILIPFILFNFYILKGQSDTIHFKNATLISINQELISEKSNLINWTYIFLSNKDTLIINYKAYESIITIGKEWCLLEIKSIYDLLLVKKCWTDNDQKVHLVFYNFVSFDKSDCSLFSENSYKPCSKKKQSNMYEITNFVDINNHLYELISINPCKSLKLR